MGNSEQAKFSIAMCTYNGSRYIAQQLDSLLAQTLPAFEIVICDDVSTDDTVEILQSYASRYQNLIRFYQNEVNLGYIHNFERAISLCTGDFIALCDQDDVWMPTKLEQMGEVFRERPDCGLIFSDADVIDQNSEPKGYKVYDEYRKPNLEETHLIERLMGVIRLLGCCLAFRASLRAYILPISSDVWGHDHWIVFMSACFSRLYMIEAPLLSYRRHTGNSGNAMFWKRNKFQRFMARFQTTSLVSLELRQQKLEDMQSHLMNVYNICMDTEGSQAIDTTRLLHAISIVNEALNFQNMRIEMYHHPRIRRLSLLFKPATIRKYVVHQTGYFTIVRDLVH